MTLHHAIQEILDWQSKTVIELRDILRQLSVVTTNQALYTYAGLVTDLSQEIGLGLRATLKYLVQESNPASLPQNMYQALDFAHARLEFAGLDMSLPQVQSMLDALASVESLAPFIDSLKNIGVIRTYPFQFVTTAQVETVVEQLASESRKQSWILAGSVRWNAYVAAVEASDGTEPGPTL